MKDDNIEKYIAILNHSLCLIDNLKEGIVIVQQPIITNTRKELFTNKENIIDSPARSKNSNETKTDVGIQKYPERLECPDVPILKNNFQGESFLKMSMKNIYKQFIEREKRKISNLSLMEEYAPNANFDMNYEYTLKDLVLYSSSSYEDNSISKYVENEHLLENASGISSNESNEDLLKYSEMDISSNDSECFQDGVHHIYNIDEQQISKIDDDMNVEKICSSSNVIQERDIFRHERVIKSTSSIDLTTEEDNLKCEIQSKYLNSKTILEGITHRIANLILKFTDKENLKIISPRLNNYQSYNECNQIEKISRPILSTSTHSKRTKTELQQSILVYEYEKHYDFSLRSQKGLKKINCDKSGSLIHFLREVEKVCDMVRGTSKNFIVVQFFIEDSLIPLCISLKKYFQHVKEATMHIYHAHFNAALIVPFEIATVPSKNYLEA